MIYTSYFSNIKKLTQEKPNLIFVSIAGKSPEWFLENKNFGNQYRSLCPKYSWWIIWHDKFKDNIDSDESKEWYTKKYQDTVLMTLSVKQVYNDLMKISNGSDICLLCYETPNKFCHRQIVSKWLNDNDIECKEI